MKPVDPSHQARWAVNEDEKKFNLINNVIRREYGDFDDAGALTDFYDYLVNNDHTKYSAHLLRYFRTYFHTFGFFGEISGKSILETGGASPISVFLAEKNQVSHSESDLRYSIDCEDQAFDIIFSFEVIEHLKDVREKEMKDIVLFYGSGTRNYCSEICRALKPGGHLVLTTPNPNSYKTIMDSVNYQDNYIFRKHVREYTRNELLEHFADLNEAFYASMFNFFLLGDNKKIIEDFDALGWDNEGRGDDHFLIFLKPT